MNNGGSASLLSDAAQRRRVRIPSVEEALQYSPFTSVIPFSPDILPLPYALPSTLMSALVNKDELEYANHTLRSLNAQASNPHIAPQRLRETLQTLQQFLNSDDLTQLRFKSCAPAIISRAGKHEGTLTYNHLQPLPTMLLESTGLSYRYLTPISPLSTVENKSRSGNKNVEQLSSLSQVSGNENEQQRVATFPTASPQSSSLISQTKMPVRESPGKPAVVIPDLPASSDPAQYQKFPEVDAAILRLSNIETSIQKSYAPANELRDQSDVVLFGFGDLVREVLEAEDGLELGPSAHLSYETQKYFSNLGIDTTANILAPDMQNRLERALTMVIDAGRFRDVAYDHIIRLHKLCAGPLTFGSGTSLVFPRSTDEDLQDAWVTSVQFAETSFRASRMLLKMMNAAHNEKHSFSEETLQLVLNHLKQVFETCLIPAAEWRMSSPEDSYSRLQPDHLKLVVGLLQRAGSVLKLLGNAVLLFDLSDASITSIEFLSIQLVFVENAPSEKESLLGIQKFEAVRRHAMDVVAKIFLRYSEHRSYIIDEILSSLEKLPVTRQNARHFKIMDGKPIQLVSALIMQLIQTSAVQSTKKSRKVLETTLEDDGLNDNENSSGTDSPSKSSAKHPSNQGHQYSTTHSEGNNFAFLHRIAGPLFDGAQNHSGYVAKYLVQRALKSTKNGDQPYRNLLDIFTEDFIGVLGSPDWPAAELLLRALLSNLVGIAENEKVGAPAKNMALDIMGVMGSGIADMRNYVKRTSQNFDNASTAFGKSLARLCGDILDGNHVDAEIVKHDGICRVVTKYYDEIEPENLQMQSARDYFLAQWARNLRYGVDAAIEGTGNGAVTDGFGSTAQWLIKVFNNSDELLSDDPFGEITATDIRLCYALNILYMPFSNAFRRIVGILLTSLSSSHATVRSRSLKSVVQLLEQDATILDRFSNVLRHIKHCASDSSPLVRDSALSLLGKCMTLKPALEQEVCNALVPRLLDAAVGVRKRAMKLLKDVYLRNRNIDVRATIADALLHRVDDVEDSVAELALATMEEIWFSPLYSLPNDVELSTQAKHDLKRHTSQVITTFSRSSNVLLVLEIFFKAVLKGTCKNAAANRIVSKHLVAAFFDDIIDNDESPGKHAQPDIFQVLMLFAKTYPQIFSAEQMLTLRPYIENLTNMDDVHVYRSVLVIYKSVLPILPPLQHDFLYSVQAVLLNNISRLGRPALEELSACLWIIDGALKNTERLVRLMLSVLEALESTKGKDLSGISKESKLTYSRVLRYLSIAGCFGKTCNLDSQQASFREKFPRWKGTSVSGLVVDIICPFSSRKQPLPIREAALDNLCLICHTNPGNFIKAQVTETISEALSEQNERLELVILSGIKVFYESEEERSKSGAEISIGEGAINGAKRLGKSMVLSDNDGATTSIAQQYLPHILRIALSRNDELALVATEVIASINRQGLVHPKETGPALVALATSSNAMIAEIALTEHRNLHAKHESMLEKEYLNAIDQTFVYQKTTARNMSGLDQHNIPKLRGFHEVIKTGSIGLRKKLLANLCARLDIDPKKSKLGDELDDHVFFTRFVLENLSFFDYQRPDELQHLLKCMEKIFAKTGNVVSQLIEASVSLDSQVGSDMMMSTLVTKPSKLPDTLRQLTAYTVILSMLWETRNHLRRLWGMQAPRDGKGKPAAKDPNKPLTKSSGVSAENHREKIAGIVASLDSEDAMVNQCRAFLYLFSVDSELRAESGEDQENRHNSAPRHDTPFEDTDGDADATPNTIGSSGKGTKRKASVSVRSTPSKARKRGRPALGPAKRTGIKDMDEGEDDDGWD